MENEAGPTRADVREPGVLVPATHPDLQVRRYHTNPCFTLKEQALLAIQGLIRNKISWNTKITDQSIVARWKAELAEVAATPVPEVAFEADVWRERLRTHVRRQLSAVEAEAAVEANRTHNRVNYEPRSQPKVVWRQNQPPLPLQLIRRFWSNELFDFALSESMRELEDCKDFGYDKVIPSGLSRAYQADDYVSAHELAALKKLTATLENVPAHHKDWHPGSNQQVLDLIHPSLFCFVLGTTPKIIEPKESQSPEDWLAATGSGAVAIEDPRVPFGALSFASPFLGSQAAGDDYQWLPGDFLVDHAGTVAPLSYINGLHPISQKDGYQALTVILERFIPLFERVLTDAANSSGETRLGRAFCYYVNRFERSQWTPDDTDDDGMSDRDDDGMGEWDVERLGPFEPAKMHPAIPDIDTPLRERAFRISLKNSKLQVIVKLASIHLTPDNPRYEGGSWHTEGTLNEGIVATGIYYYDMSNITTSRLAFRQDIDHGPEDYGIGHIVAVEGRCIAFPNTFQHRVEPFQLQDETKPGHRKILVFFLVDPTKPRLSTKNVPPQHAEWSVNMMRANRKGLGKLPLEILAQIVEKAGRMSLATAKEHRAGLMKARAAWSAKDGGRYFAQTMSLCEH
ncbi:hypothetical protein BDZ88DRAFT_504162 [Geranomyces variabilis]|nr:hypothetical protein BDZ88DRAFT_504162 [Geranomyces variabilis]KAJ3139533.1 hypothetical protein HDU90_009034 [Geranomyces variabilis]